MPAASRSTRQHPPGPGDAEHDGKRRDADRRVRLDVPDVRKLGVDERSQEEVREDDGNGRPRRRPGERDWEEREGGRPPRRDDDRIDDEHVLQARDVAAPAVGDRRADSAGDPVVGVMLARGCTDGAAEVR